MTLRAPDGREIGAVLFDLDGTVLDTAPDLVGALNHLRREEGFAPAPVDDFRRFVSRGALGLIREGLPDEGPEREAERRTEFLNWYAAHSLDSTRPFDGVETLLATLEEHAIPWGIVTNKPTFLTSPILEALGWSGRAVAVVCGDTLPVSKPDPAPVLLACEQVETPAARCMLVGDDPRDLEAADRAGALGVLAAYGYGADEVLAAHDTPPPLIEAPTALLDWLADPSEQRPAVDRRA